MGFSQELRTVGAGTGVQCAEFYIIRPRSRSRKIAWERVLFPLVLIACLGAHKGNINAQAGLDHYRAAVSEYHSERNAMLPR
jgi:hypothetical protein